MFFVLSGKDFYLATSYDISKYSDVFYLFPITSAALKLNKELLWHPLFFIFFLSSLRFHQEHREAELWQRAHVQADCDRLRL